VLGDHSNFCLYISSLKLQQISLITKFIDTYNSSNSRYFRMKEITHAGETLRFVAQMMAENEHIFAYQ
ncbi:MAG: hypothetical protein ACFNP5_03320, partial [Hoylesella saccharolytica]